jgi:hypothetical protein
LATPPSLIAPRVTPDGRHVVAVQWRQLGQLQRFDRTTRAFAPFLGGISAVHVEFSPDGEWVAWASYNGCGPGNRLWRARRDGSDKVKLSELDVDCMVPLHWSPDGRRIAFAAAVQESGRMRLRVYLVAAEGGPAEPLLPIERAGTDGAFCWAPDGESLVMHEALPNQDMLRRIDVKTRHVSTLPDSKGLADPKCARNGRILARDWSDHAAQEAQKKRFIYKMLEPGQHVWTSYALPAEIGYSTWSRDSQFIYAMDRSRLYRLQVSTGHLELIAAVDGFRLGHGWMGLAPDDSPWCFATRPSGTSTGSTGTCRRVWTRSDNRFTIARKRGDPCRCHQAGVSARTSCSPLLAPGGWVKFIVHATPASAATSPSRS